MLLCVKITREIRGDGYKIFWGAGGSNFLIFSQRKKDNLWQINIFNDRNKKNIAFLVVCLWHMSRAGPILGVGVRRLWVLTIFPKKTSDSKTVW